MAIAIDTSAVPGSYRSYSALVSAVPEWLDGQIDEAQVPGWFGLVDDEINRRLAVAPVRPQMTRYPITLNEEYIEIPADFMKEVAIDFLDGTERKSIRFVDWTGLADDAANDLPDCWLYDTAPTYSGAPEVAAIINGEMRLFPVPDATYPGTLLYHARLPGLSAANETNWLVLSHCDVYLYGLLYHANAFLPDQEKAAAWLGLFNSRLDQVLASYPRTPVRRKLTSDVGQMVGRCAGGALW